MIASSVTVGSTPVPIAGFGAAVTQGQSIRIKNTSSTSKLIIGGPDVAADGGFSIDAGETLDVGSVGAGAATDVVWAVRGGSADVVAQVLAL